MRLTGSTAAIALAASLLAGHPLADAATSRLIIQSAGTGFGDVRQPMPGAPTLCEVGSFAACYREFDASSTVVLSAIPDAGSLFAGWGGACTGSGTCQLSMDADRTVMATMNARPGSNYLVVQPRSWGGVPGGSIVSAPDGIDCTGRSMCRANFPSQTVVTLTATPTEGSRMTWGGDCAGTGPCRVSMDVQRFALALFELQSPESLNFTSLWWDPAESGWGINLNHQGNVIFATLFTYDRSGAPLWLVMPAGLRLSTWPQEAFYFEGDLYRATGSAFNAVPFVPNAEANLARIGTMRIAFTGFDTARLEYSFDGFLVTKTIRKQVFGSGVAECRHTEASRASATNYQDLWWNPAESGWGINIAHQDDTLFATLFIYDATGRDLWLVMSAGRRQADGAFFGDLYRTKGPAFNARPFTPVGPADVTRVGTMRLRFVNGNEGTLTYSYEGVTVIKPITRQLFASPVPMCE